MGLFRRAPGRPAGADPAEEKPSETTDVPRGAPLPNAARGAGPGPSVENADEEPNAGDAS